jgi:site-specific recombinase XerC
MPDIHVLSYRLPGRWDELIEDWLIWLAAAGTSAATRKTRRSHVRSVARELAVTDPDKVATGELVGIVGRAVSLEHRRGLRASLGSFYRWALVTGVVDADPAAGLPVVRPAAAAPRPVTDDVWAVLVSVTDSRTVLMARLAGEAGLRRAEVAALHRDDLLDGLDGPALIVHGKGARQRVVPITGELAARIRAAAPTGGFMFPGKIGGHISPDRVGHLVSAVMPAGWSMHQLRHRYATRGYAGTGNLRAVQECLGHASVATTQIYTAVSTRDMRSVSEAAAQRADKINLPSHKQVS